ncbi:MAG: SDR family oxidoreductase [Halobacteriota archaeon]
MGSLDGRTAIVTGASSGIGAEAVRALAAEGADVVPTARREDRIEALADEVAETHGVAARPIRTDVTDEGDVESLMAESVETFGGIDVVVNNAGISRGSDTVEMATEAYRMMMAVNVDGVFFVTRAALPELVETGGNLVFTGSFAGQYPRSFNPVYAASKWWVRGFAMSVASQYGDDGLGVTVVNPSEVRTEFVGSDGRTFRERFEPGEVTEPAEVASAIAFAAGAGDSVPFEIDLYRRDKLADTF